MHSMYPTVSQSKLEKRHSLIMTWSSKGSWELMSSVTNNHALLLKLYLTWLRFSLVHRHPASLSDVSSGVYPEVIATDGQMKHSVTLKEIMDFSWFEHCCKKTSQQKNSNKVQVFFLDNLMRKMLHTVPLKNREMVFHRFLSLRKTSSWFTQSCYSPRYLRTKWIPFNEKQDQYETYRKILSFTWRSVSQETYTGCQK